MEYVAIKPSIKLANLDSHKLSYGMFSFEGHGASGLSLISNVALLSTRSLASDLADCSQTNQEELFGWINRYCDRSSSSSADNDLR